MTTSPVVSVTDELIAELEQFAKSSFGLCGDWAVYIPEDYQGPENLPGYGVEDREGRAIVWGALEPETGLQNDNHAAFIAKANPATILALLAEREELKRDALRYRHIVPRLSHYAGGRTGVSMPSDYSTSTKEQCDAAIDSAMQS